MIFDNFWAQFWYCILEFRPFSHSANHSANRYVYPASHINSGRHIIPYPACGFREKPFCPSRDQMSQRSCTGFLAETMSKRYSLRSINFNGFIRHKKESLNDNSLNAGWGDTVFASPQASFNATHIRLFLGRLLPSRACFRFTGHSLFGSILLLYAGRQACRIKRFIVLEHCPGNHQ